LGIGGFPNIRDIARSIRRPYIIAPTVVKIPLSTEAAENKFAAFGLSRRRGVDRDSRDGLSGALRL
jgi:hypothetical protein